MLASLSPTRLDELLALQGDVFEDNMCLRRANDEVGESVGALVAKMETILRTLDSRDVLVRDYFRVGRYSPNQLDPAIVRVSSADDKVTIMRGKGELYHHARPKALHGIWVYHDLSVS